MNDKIWEAVLKDCCNCSADPITGNMPCDEGCICDRCSADWIQEEYKRRVENSKSTQN